VIDLLFFNQAIITMIVLIYHKNNESAFRLFGSAICCCKKRGVSIEKGNQIERNGKALGKSE